MRLVANEEGQRSRVGQIDLAHVHTVCSSSQRDQTGAIDVL